MADREALRERLGLNDPIVVQFARFAARAAQGDFGISYRLQQPVLELIASRLPATLELALISGFFAFVFGVAFCVCTALNRRGWLSNSIRTFKLADEAETSRRVAELLETLGLSAGDADKFPHEFSDGQRQRIAIARALSSKPEFIVCGEPTSALDVSVQAQILNLMRDLQDELGLTYLLISQNLAVVRHMANHIGVLYLGRLVEVAEGRALFNAPSHPYTRMLLDAVPDLVLSGRRRAQVTGEIPNPINPPPGCAFHPRCPLVMDRCRVELPRAGRPKPAPRLASPWRKPAAAPPQP
ncbi:MAG: ATP-binding cassette domain-containing protein [Gammaproteobacteria bacterium]|nr:ATP-binding cassette domain-containing protein [Gammaproteobacteria bacterium]